jgi:hypothetical protein
VLAPRFFMRTPPALRWMAARRTFGVDGMSASDSALVTGGSSRRALKDNGCAACGSDIGATNSNVDSDYVPSLRAAIAAELAAPRRSRGRPRTRVSTGRDRSDSESDSESDSDSDRGDAVEGPLVDEVYARIAAALEWGRTEPVAGELTLDDIARLVSRRAYRLVARLVDASDRVYGVALAPAGLSSAPAGSSSAPAGSSSAPAGSSSAPAGSSFGEEVGWDGCVYVPVARGAYPIDGLPAVFGARPAALASSTSAAALAGALAALAAARPRGAPPVRPAATLRTGESVVGFIAGRLHFWHAPTTDAAVADAAARAGVAEWAGGRGAPLPSVDVPLDPRLVDEALVDLAAGAPAAGAARRAALAAEARAPERAFRSFVADFAARARSFRDDDARARLAAVTAAVDFADEASVAGLRPRLAAALVDPTAPADSASTADSADLTAYMSIIATAFSDAAGAARPGEIAAAVAASADRARFDFDRKAFARVRAAAAAAPAAPRRAAAAQVTALVDSAPRDAPAQAHDKTRATDGLNDAAAARYRTAHASEFADALAGLILVGGFDEVIAAALPPAPAGVLTDLDFTERPGERIEWRLQRD